MKPEQQRIKIAEACGWKRHPNADWKRSNIHVWFNQSGGKSNLPDYLNDLNAMHSAEKVMNAFQWDDYRKRLATLFTDHPDDGYIYAINATASQRAEAFLRTLGLWEDEKGVVEV